MLTYLVEQAHNGLKSNKGSKSVAANIVARVASVRFNLVVSDNNCQRKI